MSCDPDSSNVYLTEEYEEPSEVKVEIVDPLASSSPSSPASLSLSPRSNNLNNNHYYYHPCEDPNGRKNRRKRKIPQKVQLEEDEDEDGATAAGGDDVAASSSSAAAAAASAATVVVDIDLNDTSSSSTPLSSTATSRLESRIENSAPRSTCPICGDKANGLHYGIYSCEGCKNFFKRSVVICQERPYVCKFNNDCNVGVYEVDGIKRQRMRCQACRYQACIDAGMYHSGVMRQRGGRHGYTISPMKKENGTSPPPLPLLPSKVDSYTSQVTISPIINSGNSDEEDSNNVASSTGGGGGSSGGVVVVPASSASAATDIRMKRLNYCNTDLQLEVEMLKSKNRELTNALCEKENQLLIAEKKISNLKSFLKHSRDLESELESLRRGKSPPITPTRNVFQNGNVTITPVIPGNKSSNSSASSSSSNGYHKPDDDMATIEAVNSIVNSQPATTIKHWKINSSID